MCRARWKSVILTADSTLRDIAGRGGLWPASLRHTTLDAPVVTATWSGRGNELGLGLGWGWVWQRTIQRAERSTPWAYE